ncbi:MAG: hypothetical protein RLZZ303_111 [Candidatus Hydrogenedentota bacterium]
MQSRGDGMSLSNNALYPEPRRMTAPAARREAIVVRLEWTFLLVRYAAYAMLLGAFAVGTISEYTPALFLVTVGALSQNIFVHFVLYTGRHHLFLSPLNLVFHLAKISLLTGLTGGSGSPFAILYVLVILGYAMYSPDCRRVWSVVLCTSGALAATLLAEWSINGLSSDFPMLMYFFTFFVGGYIVARIGEVLSAAESDARLHTQSLVSSEATLRAILDATPCPILVLDDNEIVLDANERACTFLDLERDRLNGRRVRAFIFDDGTLPQKMATLRAKGQWRGEVLMLTSRGDERNVDLVIRSFFREHHRFHVAMLIDISEQKNLQENSRLANQNLERLNRELREVNELRLSFYTQVAQRIRSPLTALSGYADLLFDESLGPLTLDQRNALRNSRECVRRVFAELDAAFASDRLREGTAGASVAEPDDQSSAQEEQSQEPSATVASP